MHEQSSSAQAERRATYTPRSSITVPLLLLASFGRVLALLLTISATAILVLWLAVTAVRVLVLLLAVLATLLATVTLALALTGWAPAALTGLLVDVDVALLTVVPAGDPWVWDLRLLAAVVLLWLAAVGGLLLQLLLVVFVLTGEGVEELFYEAGHCGLL